MIEVLATVAKEVAKKVSEATIEAAKKEVSELPEKIGEMSEAECLPEKIDLMTNEMMTEGIPDSETFKLPDTVLSVDEKNVASEQKENENPEENLEKLLEDYFDDLKNRSEFPDTLPDKPFSTEDLEKLSPEEVAKRREEFDDKKAELKKQWELENGKPWPKYETDVYSANGKLIRKAGSDYDAHHIQPLCMGGKNEAKNITPLHAQEHYDKQGIHSPDSPYSKIEKSLGGN